MAWPRHGFFLNVQLICRKLLQWEGHSPPPHGSCLEATVCEGRVRKLVALPSPACSPRVSGEHGPLGTISSRCPGQAILCTLHKSWVMTSWVMAVSLSVPRESPLSCPEAGCCEDENEYRQSRGSACEIIYRQGRHPVSYNFPPLVCLGFCSRPPCR